AILSLSRSDPRDLAGAVIPICAAAGAGRARQRHRPRARLLCHHPPVGAAALLSRRVRLGPSSRDLRRRIGCRHALFSRRYRRRDRAGARPAEECPMTALLEVRNLIRSFGALTAVRDVSLSVEPGELVGLIGPNGAGKSTLYNLIAGALAP